MAYLFATSATDNIDCGINVGHGATFSVACRFRLTASTTIQRRLVHFGNATQVNATLYAGGGAEANNVDGAFTHAGGALGTGGWAGGFTAGSLHALCLVYDGTNLSLYADTDPTPKATVVQAQTPHQQADQTFVIGNAVGASESAGATIYEVAWVPNVVWTGRQCRSFGQGFDAAFLRPTNHWRLLGNAFDYRGGQHGTVTGATGAVHDARILRPAPLLHPAPGVAAAGTRMRRSLSSLGTRTGSRQLVEDP